MKRASIAVLILASLLILLLAAPFSYDLLGAVEEIEPSNLVQNGSFEGGDYGPGISPDSWSRQASTTSTVFVWSDEIAYHGDKSVQIISAEPADAQWKQSVTVKPNTDYLLSGWIRTEDVSQLALGEAGANLCLDGTWTHTSGLTGTHAWTNVSLVFSSDDKTELTVCARLGYWSAPATGTAWFDHIELLELGPTAYKVVPILFVPNDASPNPLALHYVNNQMQMVQRWYGEQLRDRTFTLEAAQVVVGSQPISHYFGDCYPPSASCSPGWGLELWHHIFTDLDNLGHSGRASRIQGVFFQHDGLAGVALGGGNRFLVGVGDLIADCLEPGCARRVAQGGLGHELGHALGLPHPQEDPVPASWLSLMGIGFQQFPRTQIAETPVNPQRAQLLASPFMNQALSLKDGGFEDCLAQWTVTAGSAACTSSEYYSGSSALHLVAGAQPIEVVQDVAVSAGQEFDISAWLNVKDALASFEFQIQVQAIDTSDTVFSTFDIANYNDVSVGWERVGRSITMPPDTVKARVRFVSPSLQATVLLDDVAFHESQVAPPDPMPRFHGDRDAILGRRPLLLWSDVAEATSYHVQVAGESTFAEPLVDEIVASPSYQFEVDLNLDTYYFWRVKAENSAGQSEWSIPWSFVPRALADYYNDEFESGTLDTTAWSWVREDPLHWTISGPLNRRNHGYLGITTQAGELETSWNSARNLLLRQAPAGDFEISTIIDFWAPPSVAYQQGGLLIYRDDDNYIKLFRAYDGSHVLQYLAEKNGAIVASASIPMAATTPAKLVQIDGAILAYYSPDGIRWQRIGPVAGATWPDPQIGLGAWSRFDVDQVTAYFDWFRIREPLPVHDFEATANPANRAGDPGEQVRHSLAITNTGNVSGTYQVNYVGQTWPVEGPAMIGPLAVDEVTTIPITVTIPTAARELDSDAVLVTITSWADGRVQQARTLLTIVRARLFLPQLSSAEA